MELSREVGGRKVEEEKKRREAAVGGGERGDVLCREEVSAWKVTGSVARWRVSRSVGK